MVRIDFWIFGYRELCVPEDKISEVTTRLLRAKIPAAASAGGEIIIRERDVQKVEKIIKSRAEYILSEPKGLYGYYKKTKHKTAIFSAAAISLLLCIFLGGLVWDIRIDGNERIPDVRIAEQLEESGLSVGSFFAFVDRSAVENSMLKSNPDISWININRRGTVAYVNIIENDNSDKTAPPEREGYSNIVAACDSVIEEITVKHGYALVKPGDAVKRGDILISGAIPTEAGTVFCYAEGSVTGRLREEITAEADRVYVKKSLQSEQILSAELKIFKIPINIFKKYGNHYSDCDIIEDVKTFSLFGKCKLPIELRTQSRAVYEERAESYTDAELISVTSALLSARTHMRLLSSDLLRIRTTGEFTDTGYRMSSEVVYLTEIGEDRAFSTE